MARYELSCGEGRGEVRLWAEGTGEALVVMVYNGAVHIGAVTVGEYDSANDRASVSVITRLGHKDDIVAYQAAHTISKATHQPVCVVAGIHLDNITGVEIDTLLVNAESVVAELIACIRG
ncbi:hypothetical protein ACFLV0_04350 [Chloroflexota bacterium]